MSGDREQGYERQWYHVAHGLHDHAHHLAHHDLAVCVPLAFWADLDAERALRVQAQQERIDARLSEAEAQARVSELEQALTEAEEKLGVVTGRNHAILLTPENMTWLIGWLSGFPIKNSQAAAINGELRRAQSYDRRAAGVAETKEPT